MAVAPCVVPKVAPVPKKKTLKLCEPKPVGRKPPVQDVVAEIFEGYEEFLGCTSD